MQRIPSGVTDQYIYFVAVDSSDLITPETGLASFTVYRSRNGGATASFTAPTINETDSTNMPGVYELLMDEDTTLDAGDQSQIMMLYITHAGMAPARVPVEIYRPDVTAGETLTVSSGNGNAAVQSIVNNAITAASIATGAIDADAIADGAIDAGAFAADAITAAKVAADVSTEISAAVWTEATRTLTALDEDTTTLDLDATIRGAVGLAAADLDTQLAALPTAAENADAVWDEDATGHQTQGTFGQAIGDPGADTDTIFGLVNTNLDATISSRASQASVDTIDDFLDTEVAAILADTNELQTDWADGGRLDLILDARASQASVDTIGTNVDAILVDTSTTLDDKIDTIDTTLDALVADIGANGVGLTAIPWNADWDTEVESEVTDALTAYGSPTTATVVNANIVQVNEIPVDGSGTEADPWGP